MTENPDPRRLDLARRFQQELAEATERRFGARRAADLAGDIATLAETLADVATVSFAYDDAEPDFVGDSRFPAVPREKTP